MNKAFMVFSGCPKDGCLLVFAETRNIAKSISISGAFDWDYIEMNTRRQREYDQYSERDVAYIVESNEDLSKDAPLFFSDNFYDY